jgi:D-sedoheptulose 7-phosphate isomerase
MGAGTIGLLGFGGGELAHLVDDAIIVASDDYGVVEDVHMALDHIFTECLRRLIASGQTGEREGR